MVIICVVSLNLKLKYRIRLVHIQSTHLDSLKTRWRSTSPFTNHVQPQLSDPPYPENMIAFSTSSRYFNALWATHYNVCLRRATKRYGVILQRLSEPKGKRERQKIVWKLELKTRRKHYGDVIYRLMLGLCQRGWKVGWLCQKDLYN